MSSDNRYNDGFKKLFDANQTPELPLEMEEKVMHNIELEKLKAKRSMPNWMNTNLFIFSVSFGLLVLVSVLHSVTQAQGPFLQDVKIILLSSTGIFFILWMIQTADSALQNVFAKKLRSNIN